MSFRTFWRSTWNFAHLFAEGRIEAILIPVIEPVLNPVWVWLLIGEVPSGWALLGGAIVVGAVTAHGVALVWHTPREHAEIPHAA